MLDGLHGLSRVRRVSQPVPCGAEKSSSPERLGEDKPSKLTMTGQGISGKETHLARSTELQAAHLHVLRTPPLR